MPNYDEKQILFLEHIDSELFEKAIFIMKKKVPQRSKKDFVREAERIVEEYIAGGKKQKVSQIGIKKKAYKRASSPIDLALNISLFLASILFLYYVSRLFVY